MLTQRYDVVMQYRIVKVDISVRRTTLKSIFNLSEISKVLTENIICIHYIEVVLDKHSGGETADSLKSSILFDNFRTIFKKEERRGGVYVAWIRILLVIGAFFLLIAVGSETQNITASVIGISSLFIVSIIQLILYLTGQSVSIIKYVGVTLEIVTFTCAIFLFGGVQTFKTHTVTAYFTFIALSSFYYSWHVVLYAGLLAFVSYWALFIIAVFRESVVLGTMNTQFVSQDISVSNPILTTFSILMMSLVVVCITIGYKRILLNSIHFMRRSVDAQLEERKTSSLLTRYLSKEIIDLMQESDAEDFLTKSRQHSATIMFCGLTDLDDLTATMNSRDTFLMLNEYLSRFTHEVQGYGGLVDKFIGNRLMAVFGVLGLLDNNELRACAAAMNMLESAHEINEIRSEYNFPYSKITISINCGSVNAGSIGWTRHSEYTTIGGPVNISARIQQLYSQKSSVVITDNVYQAVKDHVNIAYLGEHQIRGVEKPVKVYELLEIHDRAKLTHLKYANHA